MPYTDPMKKKQYNKEYAKANPDIIRAGDRRKRIRLKVKVIERYGGCCAFCGTTQFEHLTIDHIEGNGNKHRAEYRKHYAGIYHLLSYTEFRPDLYRLLCWNCHMAMTHYDVEPDGQELREMAYWKEQSRDHRYSVDAALSVFS